MNDMFERMTADIAVSLFSAIGFSLTAFYIIVARRNRPTWKFGVVITISCAEFTLAHALQGICLDFPVKVFLFKMCFLGITVAPTAFFCLTLHYSGLKHLLTTRMLLLLSVFPAITAGLVITNEIHGWIWNPASTAHIVNLPSFISIAESRFWYWLLVAYSYFFIGLGCFFLVRLLIHSRGIYGAQVGAVVLAAIISVLGTVLDILGISPLAPFSATALGLTIGCITVAFLLPSLRRRDILFVTRRAIINSISDGIVVVDGDNQIIDMNPAAERLVGEQVLRARGKPFEELLPEMKSISTLNADNNEIILMRGGTTRIFDLHVSTIQDWRGRTAGRSIDLHDITERKWAEEALRESEERFRTTLYSIGDGVITTDTDSNVQQMNHVAELLTGWNEGDARGRKIDEIYVIFNEETNTPLGNPVTVVLEKGIVVGLANHTVLIARDGTRRPITDSGAPIRNSKGKITGVVLVFNDQTERRDLQDQLLQAQKMDAIGLLAGGVAHDFNNMIGVILGYAIMLEQNFLPTDPSYKKIKAIISAAERSANLTKQLLAFARKQIITPVPLNLNEELSTLQKMLERLIGEDITLNISLTPDLWNIKIDPVQLAQILTNLATNARDAIESTGYVRIEAINLCIEKTIEKYPDKIPAGEYVQLIFSDTGKGMNKETLSHIFEPFFTTKPKGEGAGLGLSTVFGIVQQNIGFINVYSEPNQGTTFKINFPRYYGATETPGEQMQEIPLNGTETVLVVEDEAELLTFALSVLEMHGYNVIGAKSPSKALAMCEKCGKKIDLLVTDVVMPEMNGKELKEQIEIKHPALKILFMSGYTADIVAHRGLLEEGVNFLQKPFTPLLLAKKVREVLNG